MSYVASVRRADLARVDHSSSEIAKARAGIARAYVEIEKMRSELDELTRIGFTVHDYNEFCEQAVQRNPKFLCEIIPARPPRREAKPAREPAPDPSIPPLS